MMARAKPKYSRRTVSNCTSVLLADDLPTTGPTALASSTKNRYMLGVFGCRVEPYCIRHDQNSLPGPVNNGPAASASRFPFPANDLHAVIPLQISGRTEHVDGLECIL
jgi:hypothetical protein